MAALRTTVVAAAARRSSFSATAVKFPSAVGGATSTRALHMTAPKEQSQSLFETALASLPKQKRSGAETKSSGRHFNTSRSLKTVNDSSTVDFAFMPSMDFVASANSASVPRIPLLPDNYFPSRSAAALLAADAAAQPSVAKAEISTASELDISVVAPMSEAEGGRAADGLGLIEKAEKEVGIVGTVVRGFWEDLVGARPGGVRAA